MAKDLSNDSPWKALDGLKPFSPPPASTPAPANNPEPAGGLFSELLSGRRAAPFSARRIARAKNAADSARESAEERERLADDLLEVSAELENQAALRETAETRAAECEAALAAERALLEAERERSASLAEALDAARKELDRAKAAADSLRAELEKTKDETRRAAETSSDRFRAEFLERELAEARRLPQNALLRMPPPGSVAEVFSGEIFEHVSEALRDALSAACAAGRDRRAEILEAVAAANQPAGKLERLRGEVRAILKDAGKYISPDILAKLESLGFKSISGKKHNKLRWGRGCAPVSKTPSDAAHGALNTAHDICNIAF